MWKNISLSGNRLCYLNWSLSRANLRLHLPLQELAEKLYLQDSTHFQGTWVVCVHWFFLIIESENGSGWKGPWRSSNSNSWPVNLARWKYHSHSLYKYILTVLLFLLSIRGKPSHNCLPWLLNTTLCISSSDVFSVCSNAPKSTRKPDVGLDLPQKLPSKHSVPISDHAPQMEMLDTYFVQHHHQAT